MSETYKKINTYEIEVTKETPVIEPTKITINFESKAFYEKKILDITKQRDSMTALAEKEIAECQSRIKALTDNAIIIKPVEILSKEPIKVV